MPVRITIDPSEPLEAAATVLAIVAWSEHLPEGPRLTKAHAALVAHALRATSAADERWQWTAQLVKPGYLLMDPKVVDDSVARTYSRINANLTAARAARPFFAKATMAEPPPLPETVRLSLNQVILYALGAGTQTDAHNFEQRVFRKAVPILHLAIALEQILDAMEAKIGRKPGLEDVLIWPDFAPRVVERAEQLEPVLLAVTGFKVRRECLVQLRLAK